MACILFVHQNFPGQYKHLAPALAAQGHTVHALALHGQGHAPAGVTLHRYRLGRGSTKGLHPWVGDYETKVIRAEAAARAALALREQGLQPDLICVHPGWGESLLLREVWPQARQLHYVEFFYGAEGQDVGFDPEFAGVDFDTRCRLAIKNTNNRMNLALMDWGLSPTHWQRSTVPAPERGRISVIHDGVDTARLTPDPAARLQMADLDGQPVDLRRGDEVLTFVNRNLEPCRGYHVFMRALPDILAQRPQARVLIIGGDGVSYGAAPAEGSHKSRYLNEVAGRLDHNQARRRVHFLGRVPYDTYLQVMQLSRVHVYLTYPFVLSWSLLESMCLDTTVIASDTAPLHEVIQHGDTGWLVNFFDPAALADRVARSLADPTADAPLRQRARALVQARYDLHRVCLPQQLALVDQMLAGDIPPG
ncbi:glycosyltransferase [Ideonella livida]|uniref:Glycosyltransferase n=1 Tax=Ideonella livida TaxID=2707176 RepID=A0A7C9PH24_9BURK|nr:glycosyltransferase [Ideonella livida]NDY90854.1 glycosyltransferase [Ideonella livida]